MRKKLLLWSLLLLFFSCQDSAPKKDANPDHKNADKRTSEYVVAKKKPMMTLANANSLAQLPLKCIHNEYPNKPGEVLTSKDDLATPREMHPAFYGCFDWHSSVHGHWSLVSLLKRFPDLEEADTIKAALLADISEAHIKKEVAYFQKEANASYERTYGWAWLLKLAEELHTWDDPVGEELGKNLQPLTDLIVENFKSFLPKLTRPVRIGQHENTAFGLVFAYDYAKTLGKKKLKKMIEQRAKDFYMQDKKCPLAYEPEGFSFLSPCLEEVDLMQRVLNKKAFLSWLNQFMPQLMDVKFKMTPAEVSDREDGKLVHLDGLNFSRAWVFYDLANSYKGLRHLKQLGDSHFQYSYSHIMGEDSYMGSHWLGTFAIYALNRRNRN